VIDPPLIAGTKDGGADYRVAMSRRWNSLGLMLKDGWPVCNLDNVMRCIRGNHEIVFAGKLNSEGRIVVYKRMLEETQMILERDFGFRKISKSLVKQAFEYACYTIEQPSISPI